MKAAQLKQSILQAAVQGKLVPQIPHDEPADKLLERIRQEKVQLIREGKIKKEKPLLPISEDEIPYDLPEGWVWCRLTTLTSLIGDGIHGTPDFDNLGDYYFVNGNNLNIKDYRIVYYPSTKRTTQREFLKYGKELNSQTVLLSINGTIGNIAFYNNENIILGKSAAFLNLLNNIDKYYLAIFLQSRCAWNYFEEKHTGTTIKNLSLEAIRSCPCPFPPLAEQKRIVAKVDELMALCNELEAAERELDKLEADFAENLPKAILQAAVQGKLAPQNVRDEPALELLKGIQQEKARLVKEGKLKKEKPLPPVAEDEVPYDLPEGWVWCRLSEIGEIVGGATPLTSEASNYANPGNGIAWITPADMKNARKNMISRGGKDITETGFASCSTTILPAGSVIFSSRAPIGLLAFAQNDLCTNQGFKSIVPHNMAMNKWTFYAIMDKTESIISRAPGTTFLEVSGEFMRKEIIPLPPLVEQQRIVAKVDELMALCGELKAAKDAVFVPDAGNVVPFPAREDEDEHEVAFAARGDAADGVSAKTRKVMAELLGD